MESVGEPEPRPAVPVAVYVDEAAARIERGREQDVVDQPRARRDFDELPPPPFGPRIRERGSWRRNPAKRWTVIAVVIALLLGGATGAIAIWGVPDAIARYAPFAAAAEPDLVIELPEAAQDHRTLPDGTIYFAANGTIINPTDRPQRVPPVLAELRDAQGRIVFSWTIAPPVDVLPPGERIGFSEAKVDIPRAAVMLTASWAPAR